MFGKGKTQMSGTHKFILAAGKKVGNLKPPMKNDKVTKPSKMNRDVPPREHLGKIKVTP